MAVISTFIISSTAWMWVAITHQVLVKAESSGWAVEEVLMLAGNTVWSRSGTASFTTMRITDLLIILFSSKPILQKVTVISLFSIFVTRAPESSIRLEELLVVLPAGGVGWEDLVRLVQTGGAVVRVSIIPSVPGEDTLLVV